MLANVQPPRLPMKRKTVPKRHGALILCAIAVAVLAGALAGGLHGSRPDAPDAAGVIAMQPSSGATIHRPWTTVPGGGGSQSGTAAASGTTDDGHMFHGYPCTIDCSGHKAGYNWAKDRGITEVARCPIAPQNLMSLTEGCWAEAGREGPYAQSR